MRRKLFAIALVALGLSLAVAPVMAQVVQESTSPLSRLSTVHVGMNPPASVQLLEEARSTLAPAVVNGWDGFLNAANGTWVGYVEKRSGRLEYAEGSGLPWIPGAGNTLREVDVERFLSAGQTVDMAAMERIARDFLATHAGMMGVDPSELRLNPGRSGNVVDYLWNVDFDVYRGGLPIEGARVLFRVNHGNLIQFGTEGLPGKEVAAPQATLDRAAAFAAFASYVGGLTADDTVVDAGTLRMATVSRINNVFQDTFEFGKGYDLVPYWNLSFRRKGTVGTWTGQIDARSGEILKFYDANEYAQATGGVFPISSVFNNEQILPMPFDTLTGGVQSNSAGIYTYSGTPLTSSLAGQFVRIVDNCGAVSLTTNGAGNLLFGQHTGTDCTTPGVGGAGNTHSARMQYYHVNRIKEVGRGWFPANAWLNAQLQTNVNLNQTCNAYWNGATINFFRSGGGCGNTGESNGVSLHEYGHGFDTNDGTGGPPENGSGETVGDFTAALQTHNSCIGDGFRANNCGGYGNACTACTGVRDIDWAKRVANTPSTVQNFTQTTCPQPTNNPNYVGPCGRHAISTGITANRREGHCESYISSQALWDIAARDLPNPGSGTAWSTLDRLWYTTRTQTTGFFQCSTTPATWTSDGCAAGTLFRTFRAADDDDGNLANGTPHGAELFASFNRHNIACATDPAANVSFAGCTSPISTVLTTLGENNRSQLSWTNSGAGVVYDIYRNETGCNAGFTKIVNDSSALSFTDNGVANGGTYYYQIIAHPTGTEACGGAPSNCNAVTPVPCTAPSAPIVGTATVPATNQVTVTWTNGAPPATLFNVYRARGTCASGAPFVLVANGVNGTSFTDNAVSGGVTYAYKISGLDASTICESTQSTCVEVTATGACIDAPTFSGLTTATNGQTSICSNVLNWGAASPLCSGPVTYNIHRSFLPNFKPVGKNLIASGVTGTTFTDTTPLGNGLTYYYLVRSVDSSNARIDDNTIRRTVVPTGPISVATFTDNFEGALSGGGFDNAGWTHAALSGTQDWLWQTTNVQSPTHSWFSDSIVTASSRVLVTPPFLAQAGSTLSFWHTFAFEGSAAQCFDAGTLEMTTNGGSSWTVVPDAMFTAGGFNGTVNGGFTNPLAGKRAWCSGTIGALTQVTVNLASLAGQTVQLRWNEGDDSSAQATGWFVDSVTITGAGTPSVCTPSNVAASAPNRSLASLFANQSEE